MDKKDSLYLSKSLFVRGVRCHKSLYFIKYKPELKDEVSADTEKNFQVGFEIGDLAHNLFPGGELVLLRRGKEHGDGFCHVSSIHIAKHFNTGLISHNLLSMRSGNQFEYRFRRSSRRTPAK